MRHSYATATALAGTYFMQTALGVKLSNKMDTDIRSQTEAIVAEYGGDVECNLVDCALAVVNGFDTAAEAIETNETQILSRLSGEQTAKEIEYDFSLYELSDFKVEVEGGYLSQENLDAT